MERLWEVIFTVMVHAESTDEATDEARALVTQDTFEPSSVSVVVTSPEFDHTPLPCGCAPTQDDHTCGTA